jgi:hypothetical protein
VIDDHHVLNTAVGLDVKGCKVFHCGLWMSGDCSEDECFSNFQAKNRLWKDSWVDAGDCTDQIRMKFIQPFVVRIHALMAVFGAPPPAASISSIRGIGLWLLAYSLRIDQSMGRVDTFESFLLISLQEFGVVWSHCLKIRALGLIVGVFPWLSGGYTSGLSSSWLAVSLSDVFKHLTGITSCFNMPGSQPCRHTVGQTSTSRNNIQTVVTVTPLMPYYASMVPIPLLGQMRSEARDE